MLSFEKNSKNITAKLGEQIGDILTETEVRVPRDKNFRTYDACSRGVNKIYKRQLATYDSVIRAALNTRLGENSDVNIYRLSIFFQNDGLC